MGSAAVTAYWYAGGDGGGAGGDGGDGAGLGGGGGASGLAHGSEEIGPVVGASAATAIAST